MTGEVAVDPVVAREQIEERLREVERRVAGVRARSEAAADAVTVIAVTKTHPDATVRAALDAGSRHLAENRSDALVRRAAAFPEATWHFVGRLQSNKAGDVVGRAALIHSVDRRSLVDALDRRAQRADLVRQRVLVQVNVGGDPAKGGCPPEEAEELVGYAEATGSLQVEGLMTIPPMPPAGTDAATYVQPMFASLRRVRDHVRERYPQVRDLSMGMSADLEAAVAEGATMIRIGTALFGSRR